MTVPPPPRWLLITAAAVSLLAILAIGGRCYGDARATDARMTAVAQLSDSVGRTDRVDAAIARDSARFVIEDANKLAALARGQAAAAAKASAAAQARAANAERLAAALADTLTGPVQAVVDSLVHSNQALVAANTGLAAANGRLGLANDSLTAAVKLVYRAFAADSSALARDSLTIRDYQLIKTPRPSLLGKIVQVGGYVVAVAGGYGLGKL